MSTEQALRAAIWDEPNDDTHRLVYADWLDEHTDTDSQRARAELIRVQCELPHLSGDDPRYDILEAREGELLKEWEKAWWGQMPRGSKGGRFRRGFPVPSLGRFSLKRLVRLDAAHFQAAPTYRYHAGVFGADLKLLLPWPSLRKLEMFVLRPPLPDGWAQGLAGCANLRNVTGLGFIDCPVGQADLKLLLDTWASRGLWLFRMKFDADALATVAAHPTAAGLRWLEFHYAQLSAAAVRLLANAPCLTGATTLNIGNNPFGNAGLSELLRWPGLRKLRNLHLHGCELTDAGMEELATSPAVANIRQLSLAHNQVGEAGARALANSPHLANLRDLSLNWNRIGMAGGKALAESPYLSQLKDLSLYANPVRDSAAVVKAIRQRFGRKTSF